ncbi:MAG TPA: condensation domain-containing protein, partial [Candidatus Kapabacteria bacterium]|nr:condensation domain-containing protein [Candidatus Kapabacteria bacterium]
ESGKDYIAPRDIVEEKLAGIWEDVLFGKASANEFAGIVGIDHNFFQMGGHSLKAVMILSKVHREFNVVISLNQLFKTPTIRGLSAYIKEAAQENFTAIKPVEKKEFYHLSSAQKRIYILWQLQPGSSVYNMPVIIPFSEKPDLDLFERTFFKLIERHESLRTSFHMIGDQPVQKVHHIADLKFKIEYYKEPAAQSISSTTIIQDQVNRSFELSEAPLIRAILIETKTGVEQYVLAIVMHHIVSDGISLQVMQKDFLAMLNGLELIPLEIQYKDFSEWQISEKEQEKLKSQELYWLKQFEEDIPVLDLPMDFNRPIIQKFEGSAVTFQLEKEETTALKELALNQGATLFMVLLAIFNVFLSRLSGQEDIVVGIPTAGRRHADLESVIGMFVNSLAIRNFPRGETLFNHFLNDLKERTLETFENQDYQFEDLVEKASIARNTGRNPLFDVMFTWNTQYGKDNENDDLASKNKSEAGGIEKQLYSDAPLMQTSKFDLTLTGIELDNVLHLSFQYSTKLFRESTVNRFIGYFKKIVGLIQAEPGIKLSHVQVISDEEKYRLLYGFNDTKYHFLNDNKTVHELFTGQAEKSGDRAAVVSPMAGGNIYITYRELQKKSDCLAQVLRSKGCGPGNIISIIVYPSLETIVGIMSILKTGGCYLPIDPTFPVGRIDFILADSECKLLLFQSQLLNDKNFEIETLDITDEMVYIQGNKMNLSEETTPGTQGPGNPIYMIYTSGTTGNPKGVVIKHESLINYTAWFSTIAHLTGFDRSVLLSSFAFDLGYTSIYPTILNGGQLHLLSKEVYMYPMDLLAYISRHRITYLKMTPSLFSTIVVNTNFSQETCRTLRLVLLGGEAINTTHVEIAYQKFENLIIMNHYGPTEATIGCIAQFIERSDWENYKQRPTIGKPIFNTKVY